MLMPLVQGLHFENHKIWHMLIGMGHSWDIRSERQVAPFGDWVDGNTSQYYWDQVETELEKFYMTLGSAKNL